jgi:hypothetical protein
MTQGTRGPRNAEERFQASTRANIREARTLLRNVNRQLEDIPKMPSLDNVQMGGDSLQRGISSIIQGIRRGIRLARGGESERNLTEQRNNLNRYLRQAERLRDSLPPSSQSLTSPRDSSDAPKRNR